MRGLQSLGHTDNKHCHTVILGELPASRDPLPPPPRRFHAHRADSRFLHIYSPQRLSRFVLIIIHLLLSTTIYYCNHTPHCKIHCIYSFTFLSTRSVSYTRAPTQVFTHVHVQPGILNDFVVAVVVVVVVVGCCFCFTTRRLSGGSAIAGRSIIASPRRRE